MLDKAWLMIELEQLGNCIAAAEVGREDVIKVYFSAAESLRDEGVSFVHEPTSTCTVSGSSTQ